jgi:hypothetical protein
MDKNQTQCSAPAEPDKPKASDQAASQQTEAQKKAEADKAAPPSVKA